jgi:hypothetical protein
MFSYLSLSLSLLSPFPRNYQTKRAPEDHEVRVNPRVMLGIAELLLAGMLKVKFQNSKPLKRNKHGPSLANPRPSKFPNGETR